MDYVIGVDVGGTNIKAGAVDHKGNILTSVRALTEAHQGSEAILNKIRSVIQDLRNDVPEGRLMAIGFGIPGAIRSKEGVITQAPNVPAWNGKPVRQMLQDRLEAVCFIENDANAIALGEMWMGAGRGFHHICCLTLGTGVGGGVIIEGELLRGADGMAAELGHIAVKADGNPCNCGSFGCLETYASATGMLRMLAGVRQQNQMTSLPADPELTAALIFEHALLGDPLAQEVLRSAGTGLGVGMASLVNMFNPEIIIIGGGVAGAWDLLMPVALDVMRKRAFKASVERVQVVRAERQDDAGIFGSAYMAWDRLRLAGHSESRAERALAPWGFWEVLEEGADYKFKRIYVHPGHRLSYQKHQHREETWMIASGEALALIDGMEHSLKPGQTLHIRKTQAHRVTNPGQDPLIFFEVQHGSYFGEDDIVRLQDDYKRA